MKKNILIACMSVTLLLVGCGTSSTTTDTQTSATPEQTRVATCLTEKGMTMYGTERCGHCKSQKAAFGDAFELVDYVDCDKQKPTCQAQGVTGFPTWKDANGQTYPGNRPIAQLAQIAGCEDPVAVPTPAPTPTPTEEVVEEVVEEEVAVEDTLPTEETIKEEIVEEEVVE